MYRTNDRSPRPPTVIEYRSRLFRPGYVAAGVAVLIVGVLFVVAQRATRVTCERYAGSTGFCDVRRYGVFGPFDVDLPIDAIDRMDVRIVKGSKGSKHAEVVLRAEPRSGRSDIPLETSSWMAMDPDIALEARSAFAAFKSQPSIPRLDVWIRRSVGSTVFALIFGGVLAAIGGTVLREQLGQLRPIRVVVDHERGLLIVRKRQIPFGEIRKVSVETGRALYWSSGKNEHVPGYRVAITRRGRDKEVIPVTKEFRAGDSSDHERAQRDILLAIGRPLD